MATHSSVLAWKIPWMEKPGRLQSMGSLRVGHDWVTSLSRIGEGNGNPLQCSCLENPRDGAAWWAAVYGVTQSWTRLMRLSSSSSSSSSICQQKESTSSAWQLLTACHTTNTSKVEWIGLRSFGSPAIFTWPLANWLPLLQASRQLFAGKTPPQPTGGRKCFPRVRPNLNMDFYAIGINKLISHWQKMCWF